MEISERLVMEIYNELVCCSKMREQKLMNYNRKDKDVTDALEEDMNYSIKLYEELYEIIQEYKGDK